MAGGLGIVILGIWLIVQATAGNMIIRARLVSFCPQDQSSSSQESSA